LYDVQQAIRRYLPYDYFLVLPVDPAAVGGFAAVWVWNWIGNPFVPPTLDLPPPGVAGGKSS
jgi:hypothetical protein